MSFSKTFLLGWCFVYSRQRSYTTPRSHFLLVTTRLKMVLAELGGKISKALRAMSESVVIDQAVLDKLVNAIAMALLQSDVDVKLVKQLQTNIKKNIDLEQVCGVGVV